MRVKGSCEDLGDSRNKSDGVIVRGIRIVFFHRDGLKQSMLPRRWEVVWVLDRRNKRTRIGISSDVNSFMTRGIPYIPHAFPISC